MRAFIVVLIPFLLASCGFEKSGMSQGATEVAAPPKVKVYETFEDLLPILQKQNDTTYLINFWATTCPPCIKEMPHFQELAYQNRNEKLQILLVSLDMKKHLESRVIPFIKKHKIMLETGLLADDNYSAWTDKIDESWYGALPATLIYKNEKRSFTFGAFADFEDLEKSVKPFLTN